MQSGSQSAAGVSLRRLLPEATFIGANDIVVHSCSSNSRSCHAGDLFVSLVGTRYDGHNYAADAAARGATSFLGEQYLPLGRPQCIVDDSREAYGRICHALAGNPSQQIKTIGVTGTHGKTITTTLIAGILRAAGNRVGLMGTLGHWDGQDYGVSSKTTPAAPVLAQWLSRMQTNGCTHAVVELSSHALARRYTAGLVLDAACVTNVRRDHLDFHTTLQNYRSAKARIFDHLSPTGFSILNADCLTSRDYLNRLSGPALTVSLDGHAEITAHVIERHPGEQIFLLSAGDDSAVVRSRMPGDHHIANCLIAAATGLAYDIDLGTIARGLESVDQVPGRLERISCGQDFGVYVDYAHTPETLSTSLQSVREVTSGQIICVMGAHGERNRKNRPQLSKTVAQHADLVVLTNNNPRREDPQQIISDLQSGFDASHDVRVELDRVQAICWALAQAQPGDSVVITGKGHEELHYIGTRSVPHDDREVAREYLYKHAGDSLTKLSQRMAA